LLDNISNSEGKVDAAYLKQVSAEARFLRAYSYFYLTGFFGDVPLITKIITLSEAVMPATPQVQVIDFIIREMDEIVADLHSIYEMSAGRDTNVAAYLLKSYAALYAERWNVAAHAASAGLDVGYHSLDPDYANLFTYDGENYKE